MPSKETIYHMAADIFASGRVSLRESALYAVKMAGFVDEEIKREGMPKCFRSNPDARQRILNGCVNCKHNDACFEDKR